MQMRNNYKKLYSQISNDLIVDSRWIFAIPILGTLTATQNASKFGDSRFYLIGLFLTAFFFAIRSINLKNWGRNYFLAASALSANIASFCLQYQQPNLVVPENLVSVIFLSTIAMSILMTAHSFLGTLALNITIFLLYFYSIHLISPHLIQARLHTLFQAIVVGSICSFLFHRLVVDKIRLVWHKADINEKEQKITHQNQEIKAIIDGGKSVNVKISKNLTIDHNSSIAFFQTFDQKKGDGISSFLQGLSGQEDEKRATIGALNAILGEDTISWDFNSPSLMTTGIFGDKPLEFLWSPLFLDEKCEAIILSIIDLSEKIIAEKEIQNSREKADRWLDSANKLGSKPHLASSFVNSIDGCIASKSGTELKEVIHSIKGNARILGLDNVKNLCARIEDQINNSNHPKDLLVELQAALYEIKQAYHGLAKLKAEKSNLMSMVAPFADDIRSRSEENGLEFDAVLVTNRLSELPAQIETCLLHIMNNALDHGYLRPRMKGAKVNLVHIEVESYQFGNKNIVQITDTGAGLDKAKLQALSSKKGWVPSGSETIFDVIFEAGVSTAETVSDTSGRGIGMSAVKSAIEGLPDGKVRIMPSPAGGTVVILSWSAEAPDPIHSI